MKKWGLLLLWMICTAAVFTALFMKSDLKIKENAENILENTAMIQKELEKEQVYKGDLLLINDEYPVRDEGIKTDIIKLIENKDLIREVGLIDPHIKLSETVAKSFMEMVAAAKEDGIDNFIITSGYRSIEEQSELFAEMGPNYALPGGYSEHNSSLAIDVGSNQGKMAYAPEGEWIEKNAWESGFILRYPKNKTDITGIEYEPWHIRYVGLPHSALMHKKNFVLEEYLEYLKDKKELYVSMGGQEYLITYYAYSEDQKIKVPVNQEYEISGNNMEGVLVTVPVNGKSDSQ